MRTHWICQLIGHRYKMRPMKFEGFKWSYLALCPLCGDIRDPEDV